MAPFNDHNASHDLLLLIPDIKKGATDAWEPLRVTPSLSSHHMAEDRKAYLVLLE
jgi:hypothetical protein